MRLLEIWDEKFMEAVRDGNVLTAMILLVAGFPLGNTDEREGVVAPLVLAIRHENVELVNRFIEAGASGYPLLKKGRDKDELTPLQYAIGTGNVNVVNALTAAGASLEAECEDELTPLEYAIDDWRKWHTPVLDGYPSDGYWKSLDVIKALIEAGASLEAVARGTRLRPLEYAITNDRDIYPRRPRRRGRRPRRHRLAAIEALIAAGAPLEAASEGDFTPLMYAIDYGDVPVVKALVEAGASLDAVDGDDLTPLKFAIDCQSELRLLERLCEEGSLLMLLEGAPPRGGIRAEAVLERLREEGSLGQHDGAVDKAAKVILALLAEPEEGGIGVRWRGIGVRHHWRGQQGAKHVDADVDVINVLKDAERARSDTAYLKAVFSEEYAMPDVELDFEPSHEGHVEDPWPPKAWISGASGEWRPVNLS